jgi:hypothetical protein
LGNPRESSCKIWFRFKLKVYLEGGFLSHSQIYDQPISPSNYGLLCKQSVLM